MFPVWDIPAWTYALGALKPALISSGFVLVWVCVLAAILSQIGVLVFGVMTINEAIQKSE